MCCLTVAISAILGLVWAVRKEKPKRWLKLAESTNSTGQRFVVAQSCHLSEGAGWRVAFWFVDSDNKLYGSLLELETWHPWRDVSLIQSNKTVEVWNNSKIVGTLNLEERIFKNALNGSIDRYAEDLNGVQGQRTTNFVFDTP